MSFRSKDYTASPVDVFFFFSPFLFEFGNLFNSVTLLRNQQAIGIVLGRLYWKSIHDTDDWLQLNIRKWLLDKAKCGKFMESLYYLIEM